MRKSHLALSTALLWIAATAGASDPAANKANPAPAPGASAGIPLPAQHKIAGKVTQAMEAGEYTIIEIDTGNGLLWAAGPATKVKVGDTVETSPGFPMINFHSTSLDRTFDEIRFVSTIQVWSTQGGGSSDEPSAGDTPAVPAVAKIERVQGGQTVAEVIAGKATLAGSEVAVRGEVTKLNTGIMGRNWVHLSDGTVGPGGEKDLTVTTDATPAVGSTIVVRGTVATDQDFGSGYRYDVLVENAKITVE